jgi:hypothetical protein
MPTFWYLVYCGWMTKAMVDALVMKSPAYITYFMCQLTPMPLAEAMTTLLRFIRLLPLPMTWFERQASNVLNVL